MVPVCWHHKPVFPIRTEKGFSHLPVAAAIISSLQSSQLLSLHILCIMFVCNPRLIAFLYNSTALWFPVTPKPFPEGILPRYAGWEESWELSWSDFPHSKDKLSPCFFWLSNGLPVLPFHFILINIASTLRQIWFVRITLSSHGASKALVNPLLLAPAADLMDTLLIQVINESIK